MRSSRSSCLVPALLAALLCALPQVSRAEWYAETGWISDRDFRVTETSGSMIWSFDGTRITGTRSFPFSVRGLTFSDDGKAYGILPQGAQQYEIRDATDDSLIRAVADSGQVALVGSRDRLKLVTLMFEPKTEPNGIQTSVASGVRVLDVNSGDAADLPIAPQSGSVNRLRVRNPDPTASRTVLSVAGKALLIDLANPAIIADLTLDERTPAGSAEAAFSRDGRWLAIVDGAGLRVVDAQNAQLLASRDQLPINQGIAHGESGSPRTLYGWTADGQYLLASSIGAPLLLNADLQVGKELSLPGHSNPSGVMSAGGRYYFYRDLTGKHTYRVDLAQPDSPVSRALPASCTSEGELAGQMLRVSHEGHYAIWPASVRLPSGKSRATLCLVDAVTGQIAEITPPRPEASSSLPSMARVRSASPELRPFALVSWFGATISWWNGHQQASVQRQLESRSQMGQAFGMKRIWLGPSVVPLLIWTLPFWGGLLWASGRAAWRRDAALWMSIGLMIAGVLVALTSVPLSSWNAAVHMTDLAAAVMAKLPEYFQILAALFTVGGLLVPFFTVLLGIGLAVCLAALLWWAGSAIGGGAAERDYRPR